MNLNIGIKNVVWKVVFATFLLTSWNIHALGLGDIKVSSNLGESLKARIELIGSEPEDAKAIKVRLASFQAYKKHGLNYPDDASFQFQLVSEPGRQPYIKVSSIRQINSFFVDMLIEVSTPVGDLSKSYTFLLDPPATIPELPVTSGDTSSSNPTDNLSTKSNIHSATVTQPLHGKPSGADKSVSATIIKHNHSATGARHAGKGSLKISPVSQKSALNIANDPPVLKSTGDGSLTLTLSTSLSISRGGDSASAGDPHEISDRLQEELIVKEKTLDELNAQIADMQLIINKLRDRSAGSGVQGVSGVIPSGALAQSLTVDKMATSMAGSSTANLPIESRRSTGISARAQAKSSTWSWLAYGLLPALLIMSVVWYFRRQRHLDADFFASNEEQAEFDIEHRDAHQPMTAIKNGEAAAHTKVAQNGKSLVNKSTVPLDDSSADDDATIAFFPAAEVMNVGATLDTTDEDAAELTGDMHSMIEEAELYAIHGHPYKAIEILNGIILEQPRNVEVWLLLLSIFCNKNNVRQFELMARKFLATIQDDTAWRRVQEAGRRIDPDNALYFDPHTSTTLMESGSRLIKRRLLGEILLDMGVISAWSLEKSVEHYDHLRDGRFGDFLLVNRIVDASQLEEALERQSHEDEENYQLQTSISDQTHNTSVQIGAPVMISDVLIKMGVLNEHVMQHVLEGFDPRKHGRCGSYLVSRGVITKRQLQKALLRQLSGALSVEVGEVEGECDIALEFPQ